MIADERIPLLGGRAVKFYFFALKGQFILAQGVSPGKKGVSAVAL